MFFKKINKVYSFHLILFIFVGIYGILLTPYEELFIGLKNIVFNESILITDYMSIGGIGPTLINSSITSLLILLLFKINKTQPNGSLIMTLWLVFGFSMVGKHFLNIWPTILGVYIFSKIQKESFSNYILIAVLSTGLSPLSFEISKNLNLGFIFTFIFSLSAPIIIGILLPPLAKVTLKMHQGYNLYNVGFANGLILLISLSILTYFGLEFQSTLNWSNIYKTEITTFLIIIFSTLIFIGLKYGSIIDYFKIFKHSGRSITDFYFLYKETCYLNMGLLGFIYLFYILIINADLNGAVIAGIIGIVAFGAFGKHLLNVIPISIGVIIASLLGGKSLSDPSVIMTTLFSTGLAPIAGQFGIIIGILTGFIHMTVINNIGSLTGGINLYNNGFIGGLVAITIIPIIDGLKKGDI